MNRLLLFPLHLVLFPNVPLPLHIFEERYRQLINRCIEEEQPFGVVYHRGESIKEVGCSAVIEKVIKRYDDGRMDILAIGQERFAIDSLDKSGLYLEANVHYLGEDIAADEGNVSEHAVSELLKYAFYAEIELDREALAALTVNQLSFLIAGLDVFGMDTKQEILEIEQSEPRLSRSVEELVRANERLVTAARIKGALDQEVDIDSLLN